MWIQSIEKEEKRKKIKLIRISKETNVKLKEKNDISLN